MMIRILALIGLGTGGLLYAADDPKEAVPVTKTERMEFPSGGTLRLTNSVGVLNVEAWDQPGVEITTIKSPKGDYAPRNREKVIHQLENVQVSTARRESELVVTTTFGARDFPPPYPFDRKFSFYPLTRDVGFDLEYDIKVPLNARIIAHHYLGEVNIEGSVGDIEVKLMQGAITLHLPEQERYAIHAKVRFGHVDNDFAGQEKHRLWLLGHWVENEDSAATHKLNLKVSNGNIVILKTRVPKRPDPLTQAAKPAGF